MKTIKCKFKSDGKDVCMTAIMSDDLSELSRSKKNQATDIITDFILAEEEWSLFFDRQEKEGVELGYECIFKAEDGQQTLKPLRAVTWLGGIVTDSQWLEIMKK